MIAISPHTKVYLAKDATDMRRSFRGLITLTESVLRQEPVSGHLFVPLSAATTTGSADLANTRRDTGYQKSQDK